MTYNAYPQLANKIFGAARQTPGFKASNFDLVLDGMSASPGYNQILLKTSNQHDSMDIAPYLLYSANNEAQATMFGALFAEPELFESTAGQVGKNMATVLAAPIPTYLNVYETNLGTMVGAITQAQLNQLAPSIGAGIAHTDHMLQMMRLGVQYQNAFSISQFEFKRSDGSTVPMWGTVVDMGTTNRRRPQFLTQALANSVIGGTMLQTVQTGANPTWNQPMSSDSVVLNGAHYLQSFAFMNGNTASAMIFNLNQTAALPVTFSGVNAPSGSVQMSQITSANITDSNETADTVQTTTQSLSGFGPTTGISLPPFSMTVLNWSASQAQTPTFSVPAGSYGVAQMVTISDGTPGAAIYYTTNGSTPTTSSSKYTTAITVGATETLQAIAVASNFNNSTVASAAYTIMTPAATPVFSVASGIYATSQTISIAAGTAGSSIYYTTNGTMPTASSSLYSGPITVGATETLQAIAAASNYNNSAVASAAYMIMTPAATPVFSVAAGTYASVQTVSIAAATAGSSIYYTTNGTVPTASSTLYSSPVLVGASETLQAITVATNSLVSPVASATYSIAIPTGIAFSNGFATTDLKLNGTAAVVGSSLQLTNGGTAQAGSAWYPTKVSVSRFVTDFDFQLPTSVSDGFTFTIHNSTKLNWAIGGNGSGLGYQFINNSVGVAFNLRNSTAANRSTVAIYTGGVSPQGSAVDLQALGLDLHSGDLFHVHIAYSGNILTLTLTDKATAATTTQSFNVNIANSVGASVGASTATVGFTGSTGAFTAVQNILNWTYTN
jgi:hypothetical protein